MRAYKFVARKGVEISTVILVRYYRFPPSTLLSVEQSLLLNINPIFYAMACGVVSIVGLLDPEDEGITTVRNVSNYQSTRRNVPQDLNLRGSRCETMEPSLTF